MYELSVSARIISFPNICCSCGTDSPTKTYLASAKRVTGKRVVKTTFRGWEFPICVDCLEWIAVENLKKKAMCFSLGSGFGAVVFGPWNTYPLGYLFFFVCIAGVGGYLWRLFAKKSSERKPASASSINPVKYYGWQGSVHDFAFANTKFYENFKNSNIKKLVG